MTPATLWIVFWLLPALLGDGTVTLSRVQQLDLLSQANQAFEQALISRTEQQAQGYYRQAIAAYEQLIAAGIHNAKLYYNLGNAYFRIQDLGRAIAAYRQGLRLEPANTRLQANLHYVRSRRSDQIEASGHIALLPRLFFWHDDLPLSLQVTVAVGSFVAFWLFAALRLFWRRVGLTWLLVSSAALCLLCGASAVIVHVQNTRMPHGVIVADEATVRKGNGDSYALQLAQPLHAGSEFVVLEARGAWLHIQLPNDTAGWIRRERAILW